MRNMAGLTQIVFVLLASCSLVNDPNRHRGEADAGTPHDDDGGELRDATAESDASEPVCMPVSFVVPDLAENEVASFDLDFSTVPGLAGDVNLLCLTFDSPNFASARRVQIGATQQIGFGPCGSWGSMGPWTLCQPYIKPDTISGVYVENTPITAGCQVGVMTNVRVEFPCP